MAENKAVIVTGGSGYIGTEIVSKLLSLGSRVVIIDIVPPVVQHRRLFFVEHDLTKQLFPKKIPVKVSAMIHLAARVGGIAFANKYPAKILRDNLLIDLHGILLAQALTVKRFLYASSSLVYEKSLNIPYTEEQTESLEPPSLSYGFAKLVGERTCIAFNKEYGLAYTICRLFNVYGVNSQSQDDPHGHVIPDLVQKIFSGQYPLKLLGDGTQKRHFTHVKDAAAGILAALQSPKARNTIFNIAGSREVTVKELVEILWKLSGRNEPLKYTNQMQFSDDVKRSFGDTQKAKRIIDWVAKIPIEKGLQDIAIRYRKMNH